LFCGVSERASERATVQRAAGRLGGWLAGLHFILGTCESSSSSHNICLDVSVIGSRTQNGKAEELLFRKKSKSE
jgi:hypothetical protein